MDVTCPTDTRADEPQGRDRKPAAALRTAKLFDGAGNCDGNRGDVFLMRSVQGVPKFVRVKEKLTFAFEVGLQGQSMSWTRGSHQSDVTFPLQSANAGH
ncbi:MAG: hypothetical protein JWM57_3948 [Phycisphaerales bacterium]|nr:hypothetical protein [Phycisphaerales bacterium]